MTTQEMHIALDILLQKSNSNWNKNFLPQEKDFFLNRETIKFVKQRMGKFSNFKKQGASETTKRITDLSALIETAIVPVPTILTKEANVLLPFDFMFPISTELEVLQSCTPSKLSTVPLTTTIINFAPLTNTTAITTCTVVLTANSVSTTLFNHTMLPASYLPQDNLLNYQKDFIYNNAMFALMQRNLPKGYEIQFDNEVQQFSIIARSVPFTLVVTANTINIPVTTKTSINTILLNDGLDATLELIDEEFKAFIKGSTLSTSKGKHFKGWLRDDDLIMLQTSSALVKRAKITYIRLPKIIDLLLNLNPELPNFILDEIISNTAETMKAVTSSDTYEKFAANNQLIE